MSAGFDAAQGDPKVSCLCVFVENLDLKEEGNSQGKKVIEVNCLSLFTWRGRTFLKDIVVPFSNIVHTILSGIVNVHQLSRKFLRIACLKVANQFVSYFCQFWQGLCDVTPEGFAHLTHMLMSLAFGKILLVLEVCKSKTMLSVFTRKMGLMYTNIFLKMSTEYFSLKCRCSLNFYLFFSFSELSLPDSHFILFIQRHFLHVGWI